MFSLIIAIISIALIVAVTLVGGYYGGSTISEAEAQAEAARLKNEETQILAAIDAYNAQNGRFPQNLDELVEGRFLTTVPQGVREKSASASLDFIRVAFAQSVTVGWSTPVAGQPIFATSMAVPHEVCRKYNLVSRGDDGILREPFSSLPAQCYGSDANYRIVVTKTGAAASLPSAVAPSQVLHGGVPAKDTGDIWWDVIPKGDIKSPVDTGKVRYAELELHPITAENFGDLQVGQNRTSTGRTVINSGNIAAEAVGIQAPEGFHLANNSCASGLAPGASCSFAVEFAPTQARNYGGDVAVASTNAGASRFQVEGVGHTASGEMSNIDFGNLTAGSSVVRDATLRNLGVGPLTLGTPRVTGDGYAVASGSSCSGTLAAGAICTVRVSYTATGLAAPSGTVTIPTTEAGGISASLSGQSQEARLTADPASRAFGTVQVGQAAVSDLHTVHNGGNINLTGLALSAPSGFSIVDSSCSSTLGAGASCVFSVRFAPTAADPYAGDVTVASDNAGSRTVAVSGEGRSQSATLTLASFGNVPAGTQKDQTATLANIGVGPLSLTVPSAASVNGAGFSFLGTTCVSTLPAGNSCSVALRYTASGISAGAGTLTLSTGAGDKTAALTGQSQQAVVTTDPTSLAYGAVQTGQKTVRPVTLRNTGNIPATNLVGTQPEGFNLVVSTPACSASLAPDASCVVNVEFEPVTAKSYSGNYTITSDNIAPVNVALTGMGANAILALASLDGSSALGSVGAASDSGRWPVWRNTGAGPLEIRGHSVNSAQFYAWQGDTGSGNCYIGKVLAAGEQCQFFVGIGTAGVGDYSTVETVTYRATGTSTDQAVTQAYSANVRTTTSNVGSIGFGNAAMNAWSGSQVIRLTNNATGNPLRNLAVSIVGAHAGNFRIASNGCGAAIAAGASCDIAVQFNPTWAANGFQAQVSIQGGYPRMNPTETAHIPYTGVNFSVPLSGNASWSQAALTSSSDQTQASWYGDGDKYMAFTYRNDGNAAMTLPSPGLSMPLFVAGNNCQSIGPGTSCTITVGLRSTGAGAGGSSSQSFTAIGASVNPAGVVARWSIYSAVPRWSTTSLNFGNVTVGQSATQAITLYNDGSVAYNWAANNGIANLPTGYSINLSQCGNVMPWGGSCAAYVTFAPPWVGNGFGGGSIYPAAASFLNNTLYVVGNGVSAGFTANQFSASYSNNGNGFYGNYVHNIVNNTGQNLTIVDSSGGYQPVQTGNWVPGEVRSMEGPRSGFTSVYVLSNGQRVVYTTGGSVSIQ